MRLELADYPVKQIRLGRTFRYQDGMLEVDGPGLEAMILRDGRIAEASLAVVRPGGKVRITGVWCACGNTSRGISGGPPRRGNHHWSRAQRSRGLRFERSTSGVAQRGINSGLLDRRSSCALGRELLRFAD